MFSTDPAVIEEILSSADNPEQACNRLLFHGTPEVFTGGLEPGGYDNMIWTATDPATAQNYIPTSGIISYAYYNPNRSNDSVRPEKSSIWYSVVQALGYEATDIETDARGRIISWSQPAGYPTYSRCLQWLYDQGYKLDSNDQFEIKCSLAGGGNIIHPASYRMLGRLFITVRDGLNLKDLTGGRSPDLNDLDYHKMELFEEAAQQGYDGVIINDFAQSSTHGNLGHKSIGLFGPTADRLPWMAIDARNFDWGRGAAGLQIKITPEFQDAWEAAQRPTPAAP